MASNVGEKRKSHPKEVTPGKDQKRPKTTDPEELRSLIDVVTYEDVLLADKILKDKLAIKPTPLKKSQQLSDDLGMNIYLKEEYTLPTGSFKERGARYRLERLSPEERRRGVISASAGNHASAMAYHGQQLKIRVTMVTPINAPLVKVAQIERYRATVIKHGSNLAEAKEYAMKLARDEGIIYVNGYDDHDILAGQGTAAKEILEQVAEMKIPGDWTVVVPVGGGGLVAGISAFMARSPDFNVIAVEAEKCPTLSKAIEAGKPVEVDCKPGLADGLAVKEIGARSFATAKNKIIPPVVLVTEEDIALAILMLAEMEKCVIEGAGATALAAVLSGQLDHLKQSGSNVVLMLSGGNIDSTTMSKAMEQGLIHGGRLMKFCVLVPDQKGSLSELTELLWAEDTNIRDVKFERTWLKGSVYDVEIKCECETKDKQHIERIKKKLRERYGDDVRWDKHK